MLPSIYHEYKDQAPWGAIEHPSRRQPPLEPETDAIPSLEQIWKQYYKYTGQQLARSSMSPHSPWQLAQGRHGTPERQQITEEYVKEYFRSLAN